MDWNSRAKDAVAEHVIEWLYQIERDYYKDSPYYQFGQDSMTRYYNDPMFKGRVMQLTSRLNPVINEAFWQALAEVENRYAK